MTSVWLNYRGSDLQQGDLLAGCAVPVVKEDFEPSDAAGDIQVEERDLIVLTQSCDLSNSKTLVAALCPYFTVAEFESVNTDFKKKGQWEQVRKGRVEGLHMLASPTQPDNNRVAVVIDFRQIFSLPVPYLQRHADSLGDRQRLNSPFLEHLSQAFARFFMRVGLPVSIPEFK